MVRTPTPRESTTSRCNGDNGVSSRVARRRLPADLWTIAQRKLDLLLAAVKLDDLRVPPSNYLEKLTGDRDGQICFRFETGEATDIEIVDYH